MERGAAAASACGSTSGLSNLQMDSETSLGLVKHGATLLLLDVPQFTLFGIDTQMFSVGPAFKGIKMILPGPHFVYYSSSNREGNAFSPVVGFFIYTSHSEVIVHKWLQQEERLIKLSDEEVMPASLYNIIGLGLEEHKQDRRNVTFGGPEVRYCEAVKNLEFDRQLGPYALNHFGEWKHLSNYITKKIIERIEPIGGEITIACEAGLVDTVPKTAMEKRLMEQFNDSKFSRLAEKSQRGCYYTSIPNVVKHKGICGEELTSLNLDKTQLLEAILMKDYGGEEDLLLGELQFSFIAFLMGQSLEAFLQWKAIVSLLFSCTDAPFHTRSHLFAKFIKVIYYQLKHGFHKDHTDTLGLENGASVVLDDSWLSKDIFLHRLCKDFFSLVQEASVVDGDLLTWTRKLQGLVETTLGWDFQNDAAGGIYGEDDEFAPVIEMLDSTSSGEMAA